MVNHPSQEPKTIRCPYCGRRPIQSNDWSARGRVVNMRSLRASQQTKQPTFQMHLCEVRTACDRGIRQSKELEGSVVPLRVCIAIDCPFPRVLGNPGDLRNMNFPVNSANV